MRTSREYSLHVFLDVEGEVVRPGKGPLTHLALVRPDPGVFPGVAAELVRSGELPAAALPGAHVRLLPRVRPQVGLHVRCLVVRLGASVIWTIVNLGNLLNSPHFPNFDREFQCCGGWCWGGLGQCGGLSLVITEHIVVVVVLWFLLDVGVVVILGWAGGLLLDGGGVGRRGGGDRLPGGGGGGGRVVVGEAGAAGHVGLLLGAVAGVGEAGVIVSSIIWVGGVLITRVAVAVTRGLVIVGVWCWLGCPGLHDGCHVVSAGVRSLLPGLSPLTTLYGFRRGPGSPGRSHLARHHWRTLSAATQEVACGVQISFYAALNNI